MHPSITSSTSTILGEPRRSTATTTTRTTRRRQCRTKTRTMMPAFWSTPHRRRTTRRRNNATTTVRAAAAPLLRLAGLVLLLVLLWQETGVAVGIVVVVGAAAWVPRTSHSLCSSWSIASTPGNTWTAPPIIPSARSGALPLSLSLSSNEGDETRVGGAAAGGGRLSRPNNKPSTNPKKGSPGRFRRFPPTDGVRQRPARPAPTVPLVSPSPAGSQLWRVYGVEVHPDALLMQSVEDEDAIGLSRRAKIPPADCLHPAILQSLGRRLGIVAATAIDPSLALEKTNNNNTHTATNHTTRATPMVSDSSSSSSAAAALLQSVRIVRRSLDARHRPRRADGGTGPRFVYVLDVRLSSAATTTSTGRRNTPLLRHQPGRLERREAELGDKEEEQQGVEVEAIRNSSLPSRSVPTETDATATPSKTVIVVGAGPAGLLAALSLAKSGHNIAPIVLERGQPVESRGRDIGALAHRRLLNTNSNYAYGEGGAGTWSDGKLTTRIGRNSGPVRTVLQTLVDYGAPSNILVEGAPHLGTDNLVRLLRNLRNDLVRLGGTIRFGHQVTRFLVEDGAAVGVEYSADTGGNKETLYADAVIVAAGHSARDVYQLLQTAGAQLEPKGFAVGYRVEHPQALINRLQYGTTWGSRVETGRAGTDAANRRYFRSFGPEQPGAVHENPSEVVDHDVVDDSLRHPGRLPVPSYRLAADRVSDGTRNRAVYSFCMCPGGQVVPSSTEPDELCVNGMSFSRRDSQWANSALVVTVDADDELLDPYRAEHGVLAGMAFQRDMERRASALGGGNLTVPVQRLTDFLAAKPSTSAPPSSYRLGVVPAACHEIYPPPIVEAMRNALLEFDRTLPGYLCEDGLLHAVETRTSSPVRVARDPDTLESVGLRNLFPAGEGAGFAGGIVSAAVDGIAVAEGVLDAVLLPSERARNHASGRAFSKGVDNFY